MDTSTTNDPVPIADTASQPGTDLNTFQNIIEATNVRLKKALTATGCKLNYIKHLLNKI